MAKIEVKDSKGKKVGEQELKLGDVKAASSVLHRALITEEANWRQGTQSAKTRSETRGGGRKPYKQKKTGNARQGSTRSPHYAHGSMALAVKPRSYEKKLNKKERRLAIVGALNARIEEGVVTVVDGINFEAPKTKDAAALLKSLGSDSRRVLVILPEYHDATYRSFRNLPNVEVRTAPAKPGDDGTTVKTQAFSARDLMVAHQIVIAKDALARIEEVWA